MIYFKGSIIDIKKIYNYYELGLNLDGYREYIDDNYRRRFNNVNVAVSYGNFNKMLKNFRLDNNQTIVEIDSESYIANRLKDMKYELDFNARSYLSKGVKDIIFSIVKDKDGYEYAKEINTGLLFPLFKKSNYTYAYYLTKYTSESLSDINSDQYSLVIGPVLNNPNIARGTSVVLLDKVASKNDINEYKEATSTIKYYADNNVFHDGIKFKEEKIEISEEVKLLGEIDYLLNNLKNTNELEYNNFSKKYKYILDNYDDKELNVPLSINDLRRIRDDLKFVILFEVNKEDGYLGLFEYSKNNILDNSDKPFSKIYEIDYLYELFNNNRNYYSLEEQNKILKKFSELYILIIKNNDLDETSIISSHFEDLKYYIASLINYESYYLNEIDSLDLIKKINKNNTLILGK